MKVISLLILLILLTSNLFNNPNNGVSNLNKLSVGVQAQVIICPKGSSMDNCCRRCYASTGVLGVASCCDSYLTCENLLNVPLKECKTDYYTCANNLME